MQFRLLTSALFTSFFAGSLACGKYKYFEWNELPALQRTAAQTLGYDENSWNFPGNNLIERIRFDNQDIDAAGLQALETLDLIGIDGNCWDRFVNHYRGYDWDQLGDIETCYGDNLQEAATTLGWTRDTWDGDETTAIPDSECLGWMELSAEQKWAMRTFGWTAIEWMSYPLDERCPAPPEDEEDFDQTESDVPPNRRM